MFSSFPLLSSFWKSLNKSIKTKSRKWINNENKVFNKVFLHQQQYAFICVCPLVYSHVCICFHANPQKYMHLQINIYCLCRHCTSTCSTTLPCAPTTERRLTAAHFLDYANRSKKLCYSTLKKKGGLYFQTVMPLHVNVNCEWMLH